MRQARTAEELINLLPQSGGLGETVWHERMGEFGPEVLPLILKRLRMVGQSRDAHARSMTYDKLIEALRWRGAAGAQVLLERFDDLSDYGRGMASVALGLLGEQRAADKLWRFYQRAVHNRRETHFVGALWGLIDLGDQRASARPLPTGFSPHRPVRPRSTLPCFIVVLRRTTWHTCSPEGCSR